MDAHPTPSPSLLTGLDADLASRTPFSQMAPAHRQRFLLAASQSYFAPGETVLSPSDGPVQQLFYVRRGAVAERGGETAAAGDFFPLAALLHSQPVRETWVSQADTFCLQLPASVVHELSAASPPFADFVHQRVLGWLAESQRRLQMAFAGQALEQQSLSSPLARFVKRPPLAMPPHTPLRQALQAMHDTGYGSVIVVDADGQGVGILTRHDLLGRVVLPQCPLDTPLQRLMSSPLQSLDRGRSAHDAALLMSAQGLRHVAITEAGRVVGIVSERDLFSLQRLSLRQVGQAVQGAGDRAALREAAADIRRLAAQLFAQGVNAPQLTALVSGLNDALTARAVHLLAAEQGLDLQKACWLAFGSEGRSEQTVATDQDNGLVFASAEPEADRARWLALGKAVNQLLDECGYPLCRGGIMAGNPACCLSVEEWQQRFAHWINHGAPEDLLRASIFFDLRPVAGAFVLGNTLRASITERAVVVPRFHKQLADNSLQQRPPLGWLGGIAGESVQGQEVIDLKLQGTALFVEAARLLALAAGVPATGTRQRLEAAAAELSIPAAEAAAWAAAFEHLQMLRLHVQLAPAPGGNEPPGNLCRVDDLNELDRRLLRETLRMAARLQQRIELDYRR
ncbi:MAG TPA: DUF294 nucleotidyltransferase-like domain-containing protein [Rubrivivax sp.]|nr:DUF294 nucleotidyltransferase-like domain-containing protein [Rubrivivax sp.]